MIGNIEVLAHEETPLGLLLLRRRELLGDPGTFVTEITLNHEFLMSSLHTASERALAGAALAMLREGGGEADAARVLVGGLGLGYTAQAALAERGVERVAVIELLEPVAHWLADGLIPLSGELNADPRFEVRLGDAYAHLLAPPAGEERFEAILIDIDHSPDDRLGRASDRFYTRDGLAAAKAHLAPGGVLAVWSYEEDSPFADAMRDSFEETRFVPVTFENVLIDEEQTDWVFLGRDRSGGGPR